MPKLNPEERDTIKAVLAAMHILSAKIEDPEFKQIAGGPLTDMYLEQLQYYINRAGNELKEELVEPEKSPRYELEPEWRQDTPSRW